VWFDQGVRISFVRRDVDRGGVELVEVHRPDDVLRDAGREGHGQRILFT
jgi:hypothetical protein